MEKVMEMSRVTLPDGEEFDLEYLQKLLKKPSEDGMDWPEREVVEKVTESEEKAADWIARLAKNQVTPVSLVEILDEFVTKEGV